MIEKLVFVQTAPDTVENRINDVIENQKRIKDKVNELVKQRLKDKASRDLQVSDIRKDIQQLRKKNSGNWKMPMNSKWVYFGIILVILVLAWYSVPFVWAQELRKNPEQLLRELRSQGLTNCEIMQIHQNFYLPIRIELTHDPVTEQLLETSSTDPESSLQLVKRNNFLSIATDSPDRHVIKVVLDYQTKHNDPRIVFYKLFSESNLLIQEGNWVHEGFQFCKVFDILIGDAPHILTADEIQDANNKANRENFDETIGLLESSQQWVILIGIIVVLNGLIQGGVTWMFFLVRKKDNARSLSLMKKQNTLVTKTEQIAENMILQSQKREIDWHNYQERFMNMWNKAFMDLGIVKAIHDKETIIANTLPNPADLAITEPEEEKPIVTKVNEPEVDVNIEPISPKEEPEPEVSEEIPAEPKKDFLDKTIEKTLNFLGKLKKKPEKELITTLEGWEEFYKTKTRNENLVEFETLRKNYYTDVIHDEELKMRFDAVLNVLNQQVDKV